MNNLKALRQKKNVTQNEVAEFIGVGRTTYNQYETEKRGLTADILIKLALYFKVSTDVILGIENIPDENDTSSRMIIKMPSLDTEQLISLPLVGQITAGPFDILNEDQWDEKRSVQCRMLAGRSPRECVTMEVIGDSMAPYLLEGDILVVHRQEYAVNGNIIVTYDPVLNGYTVKRYKQNGDTVELIPYNTEYKPIRYTNPNEQQLNLYGVCVGLERKLV